MPKTDLTGKQRRHLRSLANRLATTIHVGKDGLSEGLVKNLEAEFEHRELVKVTVNQNCEHGAKELAFELAEKAQAHWVQTLGRTVVLFRPLDPPEIHLPS